MAHITQDSIKQKAVRYLFAGIAALAVVHALGRFSFTPLLPYFISDNMLTITQGADLATINYFGYLIGALLAVRYSKPKFIKKYLLIGLVGNVLITTIQCFISHFDLLLLLRFLNGVTNGIVFVLAPALLLEWFIMNNKPQLSGLVYFGVAGGLLAGGLLVDSTATFFQAEHRWIPVAIVSLLLTAYSTTQFVKVQVERPDYKDKDRRQTQNSALFDRRSTPLFLSYIGAGLGYILPMTFLPTLAHDTISEDSIWIKNVWAITSLSCLVSIPLWNWIGHRFGDRFALIYTYILQALGVAAVLLIPPGAGVIACAILVGGGFLGSVMCTQRLARYFQPHQGPRLSAALIAIYAGSQLIGPWLAKLWIEHGGTLLQSFAVGLGAFIWGLFWIWRTPKT
ncbi:YbfB/YjiJ family MFS transporter [Sphingobacterium gobiense]|uniref:YbfB/YjiJ family MFS transporter n=1 Tax=Sphingobacterium gobiense TaxID=1382456 RepID=UPI001C616190|nr:YbfB/YjiJ family MFS transporter [Sphingobacterium gobiense]